MQQLAVVGFVGDIVVNDQPAFDIDDTLEIIGRELRCRPYPNGRANGSPKNTTLVSWSVSSALPFFKRLLLRTSVLVRPANHAPLTVCARPPAVAWNSSGL